MSWELVKLGKVLKQYRIEHWVKNDQVYKQASILNDGSVILRGEKIGKDIGRKRQFIIDLDHHPDTLIFTRQLLLQGSIGMAQKEVNGCIVTENMPMFSVINVKPQFLFIFLKSELFKSQVRSLKTSGTAQKSLHERQFLELKIPLPALSEQIKIIEEFEEDEKKIEILKYEITQQQTYLQLLRQTILQEAVQGKLTKQDPKDEPATELLKRIKADKEKLIKAGKLKKEKNLLPITADEIPFGLPQGWVWCRLGEVGQINPRNSFDDNKDVSFIPMTLISSEYGVFPQYEVRKWKVVKSSFTHFAENDVAVAKITPCFENSKAGIFKGLINGIGAGTTELHIFRGNLHILSDYIYLFFKSPNFLKTGETKMTGSAGQKRVPSDFVKSCLFPFPPLAEQYQIVAKVQQLHQQISELEAQIQQSRQYAKQLLQSVLTEAFEQKETKGNTIQETNWSPNKMHRLLLAKIIDAHYKHPNYLPTLGRVKGEKTCHIIEDQLQIDLGRNPVKDAAGPVDFQHILEVEKKAHEAECFTAQQRTSKGKVDYIIGKHFNDALTEAADALKGKEESADRIVQLFLPFDTEQTEIMATAYAAWNNLLIQQTSFNDDDVITEARENWTEQKLWYTRNRFQKAIDWLRKNHLVPTGKGKMVNSK